ncbi:hypothetical protein DSO57_1017532 [Entomophthora muscae]|uniref:Uncharacterized protein n=1 Tax=Entomophthora muscae TaxID=34485 RepID=A0ACC2U2K7_9FUNG|nr:hypothetical protein DSO57_1017532 [Entomophthora muscae]
MPVSPSPLNSFPPLTSKDVPITTEVTALSEARDDSALNNASDAPSRFQDSSLPVVDPLLARPSTSFHTRTVPEGLQLSIQTDISLLYSELNVISPQVLTPSPSRASRTLFQILWREEIQSKPSWTPPPSIGLLRPLWHLSCIKQSIKVGGFIGTKRLFIQPAIWRQQGLKLPGLDVKIQTLAYLQDYLCRLKEHWVEDVLGLTQGLEDLDALTLNTHQALASKFSFVPPLKRSQNSATTALFSFASKISKSVERLQSNYSKDKVEGISAYLDLLVKFIDACGFIENWYIRFASKAITDTAYTPLLARIQRFLEFLNSVILTFVLNDLNTCLVKHLKRTRELANE